MNYGCGCVGGVAGGGVVAATLTTPPTLRSIDSRDETRPVVPTARAVARHGVNTPQPRRQTGNPWGAFWSRFLHLSPAIQHAVAAGRAGAVPSQHEGGRRKRVGRPVPIGRQYSKPPQPVCPPGIYSPECAGGIHPVPPVYPPGGVIPPQPTPSVYGGNPFGRPVLPVYPPPGGVIPPEPLIPPAFNPPILPPTIRPPTPRLIGPPGGGPIPISGPPGSGVFNYVAPAPLNGPVPTAAPVLATGVAPNALPTSLAAPGLVGYVPPASVPPVPVNQFGTARVATAGPINPVLAGARVATTPTGLTGVTGAVAYPAGIGGHV